MILIGNHLVFYPIKTLSKPYKYPIKTLLTQQDQADFSKKPVLQVYIVATNYFLNNCRCKPKTFKKIPVKSSYCHLS
jgi:predicted acetyltransferase